MDRAKRKLLETTIQSRFDLQKFILLTRELLKSPKIKSNPVFTDKVKAQFRDSVKQFTDFGRYRDSENKVLLLVAVELKSYKSVARSRAMQRNFIKDLLQRESADAALVAFYEEDHSDWRISFVKIDYNFVGSTLEEDLTPARRYSFLVGKNEKSHTAMQQLAIIMFDDTISPTVSQIEEIFNIEKVTNEFFLIYKDKYLELKECLESQAEFLSMAEKLNFTAEEFAKKLMGQLSFLYFLQRKGWLGVTANPRFIPAAVAEELLVNKPSNLRDLFKKVYTLNKDQYVRSTIALRDLTDQQIMTLNFIFTNTPYEGKWGTGDKNFIRRIFTNADRNGKNFYSDYLEPLFYNALNEERGGNTYYRPFNCMIPFLNGGLFQPIVEEYDMDQVTFEIPNELFSNENLTKEGDKGDGILDIFDRYAFTVKEDEPLEKEVAVDPEMLGKVFENLLEVKDRKSKGAFYTPREIVHYMCQESLINYLMTETGISYEDINILIRYGDIIADADNSKAAAQSGKFLMPESIRKNAKKVDDALDDIRIADPAVGSGAFPLGMINEIVRARMNLTLYLLPDEYVLNRNYALPEQRKPYNLKLRTIRHSIHAVDIERSAVEITKLRLWLSLIVDEDNFSNIRPLPNLEYNIMCGNSLLEEFEGIKLFNETLLEKHIEIAATREPNIEQMDIFTPQSQNILDEIYALQEKVFATSDIKQKIALKKQIDEYEWDLIEKSLIENGKAREIPKIREIKRLNSKPYFLWKLNFAKVFRDKGGFDVVIGNPPYIFSREKISSKEKELYYKFETAEYQLNTFVLFIEKGIKLLKQNGVLSFIVPNSILKVTSMSKSRRFMLEQGELLNILQIFGYSFENVNVEAVVLVFQKHLTGNKQVKIISVNEPRNFYERNNLIIDYSKWLADEECRFQVSIDAKTDQLLDKLRENAKPLEDMFDVKAGLQAYETGKGNPKQTAEDVKSRPYDATFKVNSHTYPYLEGRDVQRYSYIWSDSWLQYGEMLAAPREFSIFSVPRLLIREITSTHPKSILCCYFEDVYLNNRSIINVLSKKHDSDELKCLLVLLNSKLISYYFNKTTPKSERKMFPKLILKDLRKFPIIIPGDKTKMVKLADEIMSLYKQGYESSIEELEYQANQMVYQLYGLNHEEIEIIENLNK
ncbi:MAG: N-6 DNA methylase [Syntrophomonadaceae bacterium]|nr:N-6 DNA methylase [Syntrophomonadaceae bacterium]